MFLGSLKNKKKKLIVCSNQISLIILSVLIAVYLLLILGLDRTVMNCRLCWTILFLKSNLIQSLDKLKNGLKILNYLQSGNF